MPRDVIGAGPGDYVCALRFMVGKEGLEDLQLDLRKLDVHTIL